MNTIHINKGDKLNCVAQKALVKRSVDERLFCCSGLSWLNFAQVTGSVLSFKCPQAVEILISDKCLAIGDRW